MYMTAKPAVLFDSVQAFSFDKRCTDLNSSESRKNSSSSIVLFSRLKRSNSRIFCKRSHCNLYLLRRRAETGACLNIWSTFSTQTSLVFSRRRPQTRPGSLRSLLSFATCTSSAQFLNARHNSRINKLSVSQPTTRVRESVAVNQTV